MRPALPTALHHIAANAPGLVYQFRRNADGSVSFPYLSEGCLALLGITAAELQAEPERFLSLVLAEDRPAYLESMQSSAHSLWSWNWEGRIWVEAWKDVKWINLRSTPHPLHGAVGQGVRGAAQGNPLHVLPGLDPDAALPVPAPQRMGR